MGEQSSEAGVRPADAGRVTSSSDRGRERCEPKRPWLPERGRPCTLSSHRRLSANTPAQPNSSASHQAPPSHWRARGNPAFSSDMALFLSQLNNKNTVSRLASHNSGDHGDFTLGSETEQSMKTWLCGWECPSWGTERVVAPDTKTTVTDNAATAKPVS